MSEPTASDVAAEFCANEVRLRDFERYAATLFVTPGQRRALLGLFAFNAEVAHVREHIREPMAGEIRLQWWRDMLEGRGHGYVEGSPVAAELMRAIEAFDLPIERLTCLIEAHQFDLYNDPMSTRAALEAYLDDTVSVLFVLAAKILGVQSPGIEHVARHAGIAYGIADVIATLPMDASRRQLFLPVEMLDAQGANAEELCAGVETPMLRGAVGVLMAAAREHLDAVAREIGGVPRAARPAFLPLALVRHRLHQAGKLVNPLLVPRARARLRILWTLWRASRSRDFRG